MNSNWRKKTKPNFFETKMNFMDTFKNKSIFEKKKNFNNKLDKNIFNSFGKKFNKKNDEYEKPKKFFNKKIVIVEKEKKNQKYSDKFSDLKSSKIIEKPKKIIKQYDEIKDSWYHNEEEEIKREKKRMLLNQRFRKLPIKIQEITNKILSDMHYGMYYRDISFEEYKNLKIIDEKIKLQNYLLVDFEDSDMAYDYYKSTGLSFSNFVCKYNLDNIIKMEKKDLFKLNRNLNNKLKSMKNLEDKIKSGKRLNKNEQIKYNKKLELTFKKKQIEFYKKYFENR